MTMMLFVVDRRDDSVVASVDDRSYETGWIPGPGGTAPILRVTLNLPLRHFDLFLLPPPKERRPSSVNRVIEVSSQVNTFRLNCLLLSD